MDFHTLRKPTDTEVILKQRQAFYYLSLVKDPRRIINDEKALDALNHTNRVCVSDEALLKQVSELSNEYNFHRIAANLVEQLVKELEELFALEADLFSEIYLANFFKISFIVMNILKKVCESSLQFCENFLGFGGLKAILKFLESPILVGKYLEESRVSGARSIFDHVIETLLCVIGSIQKQTDSNFDDHCADVLLKFYLAISGASAETRILICIILVRLHGKIL